MKIDLIVLHLDNTFSKKKCKVSQGRVIDTGFLGLRKKLWAPKLTAGRSVFPERSTSIWQRIGLKKKHRYVFAVEGSPFCFDLDVRDGFLDDHWTFAEAQKFISKLISQAAASLKPFKTWQVLLLFAGLAGVMFLQYLIIRRIGI